MRAVAFVPSAPFLLFGAGPADLRAAIAQALQQLTGDVVVIGASPTPGYQEGSVDRTPYGDLGTPAADPLPLALAVGRTLLGDRPHRLWGVPSGPLPDGDLLVVADGSAKRSEKAPGYFDPRAEGFDAAVAGALRDGSPEQLTALDPGLAAELWATGVPAWQAVAAASVGEGQQAELLYDDAPYGVGYLVATWSAAH